MNDQPDVGKIKPPSEVPPDQPDQQTADEERELKRRAPTAVEREAELHRAHLDALQDRIDHHMGECDRWREELFRVQQALANERERAEKLSNDNVKIRELSWAANGLTILGNCFSAIGAGLGVAASLSKLPDEIKSLLIGGGVALIFAGVALTIFSVLAGRRVG